MVLIILFVVLSVSGVLALIAALTLALWCIFSLLRKKQCAKQQKRLKKLLVFIALVIVLNTGLITVSQITAYTPSIIEHNGSVRPNSIAELVKVELNGRKQWISIRGWDKNKPVLLFLAGGPGGSQMAAVRHELAELEKHFVVVNWDQPGSAKSYYAESIKDITVDTYLQDGYALTEYLKERFAYEKIYLIGESWGSALGVFLVDSYPESYHAFIGTGQMIDFAATERLNYTQAMEIAQEKNDEAMLKKLQVNGIPPYYGSNITWKSATYLNYLSAHMTNNPAIYNAGYNTIRDLMSGEYGVLDKINYVRGIINTYSAVYQQLYDIDLRTEYSELDIPVYFFIGEHDLNAPPNLVEEYFAALEAPQKKLIWFNHSGHNPWINEQKKFVEKVLACFLGK